MPFLILFLAYFICDDDNLNIDSGCLAVVFTMEVIRDKKYLSISDQKVLPTSNLHRHSTVNRKFAEW